VGYVRAYTNAPWERSGSKTHDPEQKLSRFGEFDWTSEIARIFHGFGQRMYAIEAWRPKKFEVFEVEVTRLHVLDMRVANTLPQRLEEALLNKSDAEWVLVARP
jgi:hypothetical protein